MPINSFSTPSFVPVRRDDQIKPQQIPPLDVKVSAGEFLNAKDLAARIIKLALGTTDDAKVADFLRQSGFELKNPIAKSTDKDGQSIYRFEPDQKFQKSIEAFKQTGTAIALGDSTGKQVKTNGKVTPQVQVKQEITPPIARQPAPIIKQPKIFNNDGMPSRSDFNPADWHRVELSPEDFVKLQRGKNGKEKVQVTVADADPRLEVYQAAVNKLYGGKFSDDVVAKLLTGKADDTAVFYVGTNTAQSKDEVVKNLTAAIKSGKPYTFYISKNSTEQLMRAEIVEHGTAQDKLSLEIKDSLTAIDEKYAQFEPGNMLHASILAMRKESEKKAAIEALTTASGIDFRAGGTEAEKSANYAADVISATTRTLIEKNPMYAMLPEAAKDKMVEATVGFVRGGYSLYQTGKGVNDFVNDGLTDATLSVLKSTGLDQRIGLDADKVQGTLKERRATEAEFAQAFSKMGTAEMSRGDAGLGYKTAAGLSIKPYDIPNWAAKGGELTAKALPYIAIGVATGGVGAAVGGGGRALLAEIGISAVTTGAMGTGENYSLNREYIPAIKAGGMAAAQGAVAPLSAKLGIGGDLAANTVYTVALGKLEGKNDNEIFQDAVLQSVLSVSMQAGSKAHEAVSAKLGTETFTQPEAQAAIKDIFREEVGQVAGQTAQKAIRQIEVETVAEQIASKGTLSITRESVNSKVAELHTQGSQIRAKFQTAKQEIVANWGKDNKLVTREQMQMARNNIAEKLQASSRQANIGVDPSVLADFGKLATGHLEAGARSLETFKTAMQSEAKVQRANLSEADYQKLYAEAANDNLSQIKGKLSPAAQSEFEGLRASMGDERMLTSLSDDEVKVVKKFEGMAISKAKQATNQVESQKRFEQARQTLLDDQQFLHGNEVKKGLSIADSTQRTNALRSAISVETTKQELVKQYPAVQGYKVTSEVDLYQDTGFKTFKEWSSANGGKAPTGLEEINGKVWRKATDLDIVVVKENANGKLELIQLEQIKAGDNDTASKASSQMQISVEALQNANKIEVLLRNSSDKTVLGKVDAASVATVKKVTRGLLGKGGFDESLPLNSPQMKQIAAEIELLKQKGVIK